MISLAGQRAVVTGGSRGIGAATAMLLARAGADVGIGYHSRSSDAEAMVQTLVAFGVRAFAFGGDLATPDANDAFVQQGLEAFGGLDIFVGNSGVWPPHPLGVDAMDDRRWRRTLSVNLDGMFFGARAAARVMSSGGRMIFVSSTAGQRGEAGHADYAAT